MPKDGHKFMATAGHQFDLLLQNGTDKFLCGIYTKQRETEVDAVSYLTASRTGASSVQTVPRTQHRDARQQ